MGSIPSAFSVGQAARTIVPVLFGGRGRSYTPFDLLELNGADLRREPIEVRKALASILRKSRSGVRLNEHLEHPEGAVVFQHACKMGLEGIVSKRLGSRYRSGRRC